MTKRTRKKTKKGMTKRTRKMMKRRKMKKVMKRKMMKRKMMKIKMMRRKKMCATSENKNCVCTGTVYFGRKYVAGKPGRGAVTSLDQLKGSGYNIKEVTG